MSQPGKSALRNRIFAVLASLVALWAFAAYVTVGEGINLVWLATLEQQVGKPTEALVSAVQQERWASVEYAASGSRGDRSELDSSRAATDAAFTFQLQQLDGLAAQWSTSENTDARLVDLIRGVNNLAVTRSAVDSGIISAADAGQRYTDVVQLGMDVYDSYTAWDDADVIFQTSTLVMMAHGQEMISREAALVSGIISGNSFSSADAQAFTELVGAQRYLTRQIQERLPQPDRADFERMLAGPAFTALRALEEQISRAPAGRSPVEARQTWRSAVEAAVAELRAIVIDLADRTVARIMPSAIGIIVRLILAAGLGLIAVIFSIRFAIRGFRALQQQLSDLRVAALDLAHIRLPLVVEQLKRGEQVSAPPPLQFGDGDVGQVGQAFNAVQQTAIQATVEQAELRRGVREVFLSLAHRIQALIHRQLKLIDTMERRSTTDSELAELYQIDHLATRVRRNAENLIVLSGLPAGRSWRGPVSIVDVLRGAVAEVEDYPRIRLKAIAPAAVSGHAVGDVIHLVAELMENAAAFSSPKTEVLITGLPVGGGYLIEIEDSGLGMTPADLDAANARLAEPPEFQLSANARLGYFVVGKLAQRYDIQVTLQPTRGTGVTAAIFLPAALLITQPPPSEVDEPVLVSAGPALTASEVSDRVTPVGLPVRARKSVPAPRPVQPEEDTIFPNGRSPEEVGKMMAAFAAAKQTAAAQQTSERA